MNMARGTQLLLSSCLRTALAIPSIPPPTHATHALTCRGQTPVDPRTHSPGTVLLCPFPDQPGFVPGQPPQFAEGGPKVQGTQSAN